jgi:hypothetical protein
MFHSGERCISTGRPDEVSLRGIDGAAGLSDCAGKSLHQIGERVLAFRY